VRERADSQEILFTATGTLCLLAAIDMLLSQLFIMFFDKSIDARILAFTPVAVALVAPLVGMLLGPRRGVVVTGAALGVSFGLAVLVRDPWLELSGAIVAVAVGMWWFALVAGSRSGRNASPLPVAVPAALAGELILRSVARSLPLDELPLPIAVIAVGALWLVLAMAGRAVIARPRRWVTTDLRGTVALFSLPFLFWVATQMALGGATIAGAAGLGRGTEGASSTFIGLVVAGCGVAAALLAPRRVPHRGIAAATAVALGTALVLAHLGIVSLAGGALLAFGVVLGAEVLVDVSTLEARVPLAVSLALGAGWLASTGATTLYYYRVEYQPALIAAVVVATFALALAIPGPTGGAHERAISGIAALALLVPAVALVTTPAATIATHAGPLRVMAYNVHLGYDDGDLPNLDAIASVIRREDPDLVALTEVPRGVPIMAGHDVIGQLAERLRMSFAFAPMMGDTYGLAVLSRLPIDDMRVVPLTQAPGSIDVARVALFVRAGGLTLVATHLGGDRIDLEVRSIIEAIGGTRGVIVAGDLNSVPESEAMRLFAQTGFTDLGAAQDAKTFPPSAPDRRIDYLWAVGATATGVRTVSTRASDHLPVVADITVP
jgi:endonuclease/exonuclease/phosphatase family metal-dependent hydrolase